jgi:fatty acid desaturase
MDGRRRAHAVGRLGAVVAIVAGLAVAGLVALFGTALVPVAPVVLLGVGLWLWRRHAGGPWPRPLPHRGEVRAASASTAPLDGAIRGSPHV